MWKSIHQGLAGVEPAVKQFLPPCQMQCPINEDIQRTNVLISLLPEDPELARDGIIQIGDYLYEKNPLFTVCGYVCGLCELECNYQAKGGRHPAETLKEIHCRYLHLYQMRRKNLSLSRKGERRGCRRGPGGLMCAYDLSKRGYRVTIFEASDRLGGALWLIPRYRLPEKVLTSAIENLVRHCGDRREIQCQRGRRAN